MSRTHGARAGDAREGRWNALLQILTVSFGVASRVFERVDEASGGTCREIFRCRGIYRFAMIAR